MRTESVSIGHANSIAESNDNDDDLKGEFNLNSVNISSISLGATRCSICLSIPHIIHIVGEPLPSSKESANRSRSLYTHGMATFTMWVTEGSLHPSAANALQEC